MSFWKRKRAKDADVPEHLDRARPVQSDNEIEKEKFSFDREIEKVMELMADSPTTDARKLEAMRQQIDSMKRIEDRLRELRRRPGNR
jgi:hypothetical protein